MNMKLCNDLDLVYNEYLSEFNGHDIRKKMKVLREKKGKSEKEKKELAGYERNWKALKAIKNARDHYCYSEDVEVKIKDLVVLQEIWKEEIRKYHVGWLPKYKNIVSAMERILKRIK